jgi:ribosomal protein RSM22 (predicted rRNA methylase)
MKSYNTPNPNDLETKVAELCLPEAAFKQYLQGKISDKYISEISQILLGLSERYIKGDKAIMSSAEVHAYALYYLPVNLAKIRFLLTQLRPLSNKPLKLLDFGCGPGTAALACLQKFDQIQDVSLIDSSTACLEFAARISKIIAPKITIQKSTEITSLQQKDFDLIIAANVLNELSAEQRESTLTNLLSLLAKDGQLLILEPASFDKTRQLMKDRDLLLSKNSEYSLIFPCTHSKPCPMLKDPENWCHGILPAREWRSSELVGQIDTKLGFNKHRIKYSSLIFQNSSYSNSSAARVIRTSDNKSSAQICCQQGLINLHLKTIKDTQSKRSLKSSDNFQLVELAKVLTKNKASK